MTTPKPPRRVRVDVPKRETGLQPGVIPTGAGWRKNEGHKPNTRKKRAIVKLFNGRICGEEPVSKEGPTGWAVEGIPPTRWTITGSPWDIEFFKLI